jgi:low affinity Fe/Cu permease
MSEIINDENVTNETQAEVSTEKPEKVFTQDEVNKLLAKRVARANEKYADYDDIKAKLDEFLNQDEERKRSELTEIERYQKDLEKIAGERDALTNQITDWQSKFQKQAITNEFIKVASSLNVQYVDDAIKLADLSAVTVGEDGKVEGVEDVVKALVEYKPFLVAQKQPQKLGEPTGGHKDTSDKTADQLLAEAADKARRSGKDEDRVAYAILKSKLSK